MKKKFNKYYITALYLCTNFVLFAQPGSNNGTSDLESADAPPAPINNYLWVLAFVGILFIFMKLRAFLIKEKSNFKK
jgi:hypothetical protein